MEESQLENESPNLESIAKKLLDGGPSGALIPSQSSKESIRPNVRPRPIELANDDLGKPAAKRLKVSQEECISVQSSPNEADESVEVLSAKVLSSEEPKKAIDQTSSKN